jgi:hypothetical protein
MTTDPILRAKQVRALKAYYRDSFKQFAVWAAGDYRNHTPQSLPYPGFCRSMKYEAKTRSGSARKNDGTNWVNGRCKYHGGASTGPVTSEGKKRVPINSKRQTPCGGLD